MNPRPAYAKLKARLIELDYTWEQTKAIGREFDVSGLALTPDEYKSLRRSAPLVIRWIKADFKERQYTGTLKAQLFTRLDDMAVYLDGKGLSDSTGEEKLERAFNEWKEARNG